MLDLVTSALPNARGLLGSHDKVWTRGIPRKHPRLMRFGDFDGFTFLKEKQRNSQNLENFYLKSLHAKWPKQFVGCELCIWNKSNCGDEMNRKMKNDPRSCERNLCNRVTKPDKIPVEVLNQFSDFSTQLLKLRSQLRWSFFMSLWDVSVLLCSTSVQKLRW